jgi:hypothetical protein
MFQAFDHTRVDYRPAFVGQRKKNSSRLDGAHAIFLRYQAEENLFL